MSISNVTIVTPNLEDMLAFDTGPANMPIDYFAKGIDDRGMLSSKGVVIQNLLDDLMKINFFKEQPPKAAGYDEFGPEILDRISKPYLNSRQEDLVSSGGIFSTDFSQCLQGFYLTKIS